MREALHSNRDVWHLPPRVRQWVPEAFQRVSGAVFAAIQAVPSGRFAAQSADGAVNRAAGARLPIVRASGRGSQALCAIADARRAPSLLLHRRTTVQAEHGLRLEYGRRPLPGSGSRSRR